MILFRCYFDYLGDNNRFETYFKAEQHGHKLPGKRPFSPPVAILPTKETGLISVDTSTIKAAFQLACHPGMVLFESISTSNSAFFSSLLPLKKNVYPQSTRLS